MYLIHFPEEGCFKVGLTHSTSHRINLFPARRDYRGSRRGRQQFLAEIVEVDVLDLTEAWHQLGNRERPGRATRRCGRTLDPPLTLSMSNSKHPSSSRAFEI